MAKDLDALRSIPLELVMERMGGERDPADPTRNWLHPVGRITVTGDKFYNHTTYKGSGGSIDLTMHLGEFSFKEAISFLSSEFGPGMATAQYITEARARVAKISKETPIPKNPASEIPPQVQGKTAQVINYLTKRREIPEPVVTKAINKGNLWADLYGNCVFPLRDSEGKVKGAEIRGTYDKPFHGTRGEKSSTFFYCGSAKGNKVSFVESGIDALSYEALHPETLVLSTTGGRREAVVAAADRFLARGYQVALAFDADKAGDNQAARINEDLGGRCIRERPTLGKDWNDQLITLLQQQRAQTQTQTKASVLLGQAKAAKSRSEIIR